MSSSTNRIAVVTGAASGIGLASARALRNAGFQTVAADLNDGAPALVGGSDALPPVVSVSVDIADPSSVDALRDRLRELGPPSVIVNCAGWTTSERFLDNDQEFIHRVVAINFTGAMLVTRALVPEMVEHGVQGRVINIASDAGRVGSTGETVYAGAKGGVISFTKSLARELARDAITVNCVCPGPTDTPMLAQQPERYREALTRAIPLRRLATPEDIANAVTFFASEKASYITGQVLSVSGGLTMAG